MQAKYKSFFNVGKAHSLLGTALQRRKHRKPPLWKGTLSWPSDARHGKCLLSGMLAKAKVVFLSGPRLKPVSLAFRFARGLFWQ